MTKDFVRFLWFENVENLNVTNKKTLQFGMYRFCQVLFSVSTSSFLLTGTLIPHASSNISIDPLLVTQSLQVHDFYSGKSAVETAYQFYLKCKELLSEASFNFHKCESKSADLKVLATKILGLQWDKSNDTFIFDMKNLRKLIVMRPTEMESIQIFPIFTTQ